MLYLKAMEIGLLKASENGHRQNHSDRGRESEQSTGKINREPWYLSFQAAPFSRRGGCRRLSWPAVVQLNRF